MSEGLDDSWDPEEPWVAVLGDPDDDGSDDDRDSGDDGDETFRISLPPGIAEFVVRRLQRGARAFDDGVAISIDEGDSVRELRHDEITALIDDASAALHDTLDRPLATEQLMMATQASTILATIWSTRLHDDDVSAELPPDEYAWVAAIAKLATDCEQMLFARVRPRSDGTYSLRWRAADREVIATVMADMSRLLSSDDPAISRLFPSAYGSDEERNAGWDALMRGELIERRLEALATVDELLRRDRCTADELNAFMRSLNDARLVLGTRLDVDEGGRPADLPESERAAYAAFEHLGFLLSVTIRALRGSL